PRVTRDRVFAVARVAAAFAFQLEDFEVREARLGELPASREPGDPAADDGDGDTPLARRSGEPTAAQQVSDLIGGAEQVPRERCRRPPWYEPDGAGRERRCRAQQERAPIHQSVTRRHSA